MTVEEVREMIKEHISRSERLGKLSSAFSLLKLLDEIDAAVARENKEASTA